jgi:glycosyl transferase family 2
MSPYSSAYETGVLPRLSVVVPVRPNTPELGACLTALIASDIPRSAWELIVVTSARDEEAWLVGALHADTVVRLPDGSWGAGYARNRGVEVSRAPYLVFISADVCVGTDALRGFAELLDSQPEVGAVCGTYVDEGHNDHGRAALYQTLAHQFRSEFGAGRTDTFSTGFAAIRRDLFVSAGMFDEWRVEVPHVEGVEFGRRLLTLGSMIVVRPDLRASHLKKWTLWRTLGQSLRDPGIPWQDELCMTTDRIINPGLRALRRIDAVGTLLVWTALVAGVVAALTGSQRSRTITLVLLTLTALSCLPICTFVARRRSLNFALLVLPIHLARLLLRGLGVSYNWLVRHIIGEPRPGPAIEAFAEVGLATWPPVPQRRALRQIVMHTESGRQGSPGLFS